jgi:hypothetical protein
MRDSFDKQFAARGLLLVFGAGLFGGQSDVRTRPCSRFTHSSLDPDLACVILDDAMGN